MIKSEQKVYKPEEVDVMCSLCGAIIKLDCYDKHYERCLDVDYLEKNNMKYFNKGVDKEKLRHMNDIEFLQKYNKFSEYILENTRDKEERENIMKYFLGG